MEEFKASRYITKTWSVAVLVVWFIWAAELTLLMPPPSLVTMFRLWPYLIPLIVVFAIGGLLHFRFANSLRVLSSIVAAATCLIFSTVAWRVIRHCAGYQARGLLVDGLGIAATGMLLALLVTIGAVAAMVMFLASGSKEYEPRGYKRITLYQWVGICGVAFVLSIAVIGVTIFVC